MWTPYRKCDIENSEKVQKKATEILPKISPLKYSDRLKACKLPTLQYRRIRGDMIKTYKILYDKYDIVAVPNLTTSTILTT